MSHGNESGWDDGTGRDPKPASFDGMADGRIKRSTIRKFREQIHALGALWIIIGLLSGGMALVALNGDKKIANSLAGDHEVLVIIFAIAGTLWFILGVATCLKQIWAVYTALVLSYLSLLSNLLNVNVCGIVIVILVILQAHRVISWAAEFKAAGVPLTARPT